MDASIVEGEDKGSMAWLYRDHTECWINGFSDVIRTATVLEVETLAILHGLHFLREL